MKLKRESSQFADEHEMLAFCQQLEAQGFRAVLRVGVPQPRSYSVQSWTDRGESRHWRVDWHEQVKR